MRLPMSARLLTLVVLLPTLTGCAIGELLGYAVNPDYPRFRDGDRVELAGLQAPVQVAQRPDGLWRIDAENEADAMMVVGYLQARDRMAQLDLLRHVARGEVATFIGNQMLAGKTAVESDRMQRFLGFERNGRILYERTSAQERAAIDAFVRGINAWIAVGHRPLEHRLLGIDSIRAWTPEDSLAIYLFLMHSLAGNADREIRRLLVACAAGIEAMERIWPTDLEFDVAALPPEDWGTQTYPRPPAVVDEIRAELAELCPQGKQENALAAAWPGRGRSPIAAPLGRFVQLLQGGLTASNNWVVAGMHTRSGKPLVANDPHLPHMNPPLVWGMEMQYPGHRVAGFALPGVHRVVFGHNGHAAWGATTNFVDRQDLVIHKPRTELRNGRPVDGYDVDGNFIAFETRTERFEVRGGKSIEATVRFTKDGPLLNDLEPFVADKVPLTALRTTPLGRGTDLDGARALNQARNATELEAALDAMDQGCSNWVYADAEGNIGYRSPCLTPKREGYRGTFPVPGWLGRYAWDGLLPKEQLPASKNPARGWLATANSRIVPADRMPSAYNNDESAPNRVLRIERRIKDEIQRGGLTPETSAAIQMDIASEFWPRQRAEIAPSLCVDARNDDATTALARGHLCAWDGAATADSVGATMQVLLTNALLDRALADDLPNGVDDEIWHYMQSLIQFEANVQRLWIMPVGSEVWDDVRTPEVETRAEILQAAFADAVAYGVEHYGADVDAWQWGRVRPFVLAHAFAAEGGLLGVFFNTRPLVIGGDTETPFKQQFPRSDREHMRPALGPLMRLTVDLAEPWAATYSMAGGESGWPDSPFYANLLEDWSRGKERPLTPPAGAGDVRVSFLPGA